MFVLPSLCLLFLLQTGVFNGSCIQQTNDGFILIGSTSSDSLNKTGPVLIKMDMKGYVLWSRIYTDKPYGAATSLLISNDNKYILAGSTHSLITTDSAGNMIWGKILPIETDSAYLGPEINTIVQAIIKIFYFSDINL